jgi:vitamin K-dependent gamma-carboxylase
LLPLRPAPREFDTPDRKRYVARVRHYLSAPVDTASLALFRILFGLALSAAAIRFVAKGWVRSQLIDPTYHFTYPHLGFIRPLPAPLLYAHFALLIAAAIALTIGYRTKLSAATLALGWAYIELLDRATYLNHYYLATSLALLLACTPAGAAFSLDARLHPESRAATMPRWVLLALRLQVAVVYVFAGIAKLNADWLLRAQPLRIWLAATSGKLPWLETWLTQPASAFVASWLGAGFDLAIVPLLLWQRTRVAAFVSAAIFHAVTGLLFPIGMFPWIMLACATLLLAADWPRAWLHAAHSRSCVAPPRAAAWTIAIHCALQLAVPLHHHLLVRDSVWTSAGFDFAWKIMLAEKSGSVRFTARDRANGRSWAIAPSDYLTPLQELALARDPRLIVAFARHLASDLQARTGDDIAVFADAFASLNGRPAQRLIAADVDLTRDPLPEHLVLPLDN